MMETAQSFTARRSAASQLPTFQLPPPDHLPMPKYPAYAPSTSQPPPAVSSVLTPPVGLPDGHSPIASSINSGSSGSSTAGVPPYQQPMGYWPQTQSNASYTYSAAPSMPATFATGQQNNYMGRPIYSPMNFPSRNTNSPTAGEGLPPPPYEISLPSFSNGMSGGPQQNLPNLAPQQQQQQQQQSQSQQQQHQQQNQQHQQQMNNSTMAQPQQQQQNQQHQQQMSNSSMAQPPATQAPQQSSMHAPDSYGRQPPPPPPNNNYYTPSSTPQQSSFPAYAQQSPTQQHSPNQSSAPPNRISPVSAHGHSALAAPQGYHAQTYGRYNLPAMSGPIMSNVHSPGGQLALVGGMPMGYQQHPMGAPMYGHPGQQQPQNDRPFKCDQCPQSFNRNHDLKRHKRIHLAVKPFPCTHCEKSFSRKDALKRHILVKGCGKTPGGGASNANGDSQSPVDKNEVMSDSTEDNSPEMMKKEL